jgi:hypothetical protein
MSVREKPFGQFEEPGRGKKPKEPGSGEVKMGQESINQYTGHDILLAFARLARKRGYPYKIVGDHSYRSRKEGDNCYKNRIKLFGSKFGVLQVVTFKNNQIVKREAIPMEDVLKEIGEV